MQNLRVKDWKKFQHFKNRHPPWIKLYRDILDDIEWHKLDGNTAKILVMLWVLASEDKELTGSLPCISEIAFRLRLPEKQIIQAIQRLEHFIYQGDIKAISNGYQDDPLETETETETETEIKKQRDINIEKNKKTKYGEFQNVFLTDEEFAKLKEKFGKTKTLEKIETLSGYKASKGKTYKSDYATILTWAKKDEASAAPQRRAEIVHTCQEKCTKCGAAPAVRDGLCRDCYGVVPMPDYFREVFDKAVKPMP